MFPPHIVMWFEDRHVGTPDGDPATALQDGLLLLKMLHCHLEHPPDFPSDVLERWKLIATLFLDAGIEMTDTGLRLALMGDRKTLMTLLQCVYCIYHPSEGLNLPIHLEPEQQLQYPPMAASLIESAKTYDELVDRIRVVLQTEHPEHSTQEIGGLLLEELAMRLNRVVAMERYEDFMMLVVGQMKSPVQSVCLRACGIFHKLIGAVSRDAMFHHLVVARSSKLAQVQENLVNMLFADNSTPELLDFLHGTLVDLSTPSRFRGMCEGLLMPRLSQIDMLHELSKFTEYSAVLGCPDLPWIIHFVADRLHESTLADADESERMDAMETALVLLLRLWTESPAVMDDSGEIPKLQQLLLSPMGVQLCCRQVVLSELTSVVFVSSDMYQVLIHALSSVMKHTQLRRPLLRSFVHLHTSNTALSLLPLVDCVREVLPTVHCGIAEGDFVNSLGKHPQLSIVFTETTGMWLELMHKLIESEPFMHTYCCNAIAQLTTNMHDDPDLISSVGFIINDLLRVSEEHSHSTLLLHCVGKLHKGSPSGPQEHIHRTVFMFVQRLLRRLDEEREVAEQEARQKRAMEQIKAAEEQRVRDQEARKRSEAEAAPRPASNQSQSQQLQEADNNSGAAKPPTPADGSKAADPAPNQDAQTEQTQQKPPTPAGQEQPAEKSSKPTSADQGAKPATAESAKPATAESAKPATAESAKPATAESKPEPAKPEEKVLTPEEQQAQKESDERAQRREVWLSTLKQLCSEMFIQFKRVPVAELDPPPPTPPPQDPASVKDSALNDDPSPLRDEDYANAEDIFAMTNGSQDNEGGLVHAQSFTTESSEPPRRVVNIKEQSRETLAKINFRKLAKYMTVTYVDPMFQRAMDYCARKEFRERIKTRGRIMPDHKVSAEAKLRHEQALEKARKEREAAELERIRRRDENREKRDREIKRMMQSRMEQAEIDKTPASPKYYVDNLINTKRQETEERKEILASYQREFVELYRACRADYEATAQIDARNERLRAREEQAAEAQKRDLLKSKLSDYFEVKRQQEELARRNEWEQQMQEEFDKRLEFAKRSDALKRKLLHWKMEKEHEDQRLEQSRARNSIARQQPQSATPPPAKPRQLPPLGNRRDSAPSNNNSASRRDSQDPPPKQTTKPSTPVQEQQQQPQQQQQQQRQQSASERPPAEEPQQKKPPTPKAAEKPADEQKPPTPVQEQGQRKPPTPTRAAKPEAEQQQESTQQKPPTPVQAAQKPPTPVQADKPNAAETPSQRPADEASPTQQAATSKPATPLQREQEKRQSKPPTPVQGERGADAGAQAQPATAAEEPAAPSPQRNSKPPTPTQGDRSSKPPTPVQGDRAPTPVQQQESQQQKPPTPAQGDKAATADELATEQPAAQQKPPTPVQAAKPQSKPPTPVQSEKPPTPAEEVKPASKPPTPVQEAQPASKPPTPVQEAKPASKPPTPAQEAKPASKPPTPMQGEKPAADATAQERANSKPPTPIQTERPPEEAAAKPATPVDSEKPEAKTASKPPTPTQSGAKPDSKPPTPLDGVKPPTPASEAQPASKPPTPTQDAKQASKPPTPMQEAKPASKPPTPIQSERPAEAEAAPKPATPLRSEATAESAPAKPPTPAQSERPSDEATPAQKPPTPAQGDKPAEASAKPATPLQSEKPAEPQQQRTSSTPVDKTTPVAQEL